MASDVSEEIVQRLRDAHHFRFTGDPYGMEAPSLYTEAADEIERLRETHLPDDLDTDRVSVALTKAGVDPVLAGKVLDILET